MRNLFEENNVIFADGENAKEGAFTGYLRAFGTPVCYFGPSYQDVYTVVHELGHYYSYLAQDGGELVLDLAELQSQGNEFLFTAFLAENQDPVYTAIVAYQLFNTVLSIVSCCIVDEFEQYVYTNEIIDPYTELDEIMQDICDSYDGGTLTDILDMESYWRHVVIESPVYYISYAVSGISALELYSYGVADFGVAAEMYVALIEGADHSKSYLEILEAAGLGSPFDASTYERIGALKAGW